ncbi:MAG: sigma 54-interacting transcriptional regulator [Desulfosarcinaceae bacterium]|jgi:transcriptional regulator of aroF, aroG, tyrA and aromatic amino acid transport
MSTNNHLKLSLRFSDRVGIVADISRVIAEMSLNIAAMEVVRKADEALVFVEIEEGPGLAAADHLISRLNALVAVREVGVRHYLPHEEREKRFRVVLDNMSDGVFSIDRHGRVTTINKVACRALGCRARDVVGRPLDELGLPDNLLLKCLEGEEFSHLKQNLITDQGRFEFFLTGRPTRDDRGRIIGAVAFARDMREIRKLARSLTDPPQVGFTDIVGRTPAMQNAIAFAQKIAPTDALISIYGESGTGKELFARAIHSASGRKGPFVPVNCAALPENLLESELFGYEGGSFTGGKPKGRQGLFEIGAGGTVFLDEVAELSQAAQAKILRLIQERAVRRIGATREVALDARIITATNCDLEQRVRAGRFRQDLYYRINVLPLHIPPLRYRREDLANLASHFLFRLAGRLGKRRQRLSAAALAKLETHLWPGNVRELKNVAERASILSDAEIIDAACILFSHELGQRLHGQADGVAPPLTDGSLKAQTIALEMNLIRKALAETPSIRQAALRLGISHSGLIKKMRKLDLKLETNKTSGN